jgi:hypothetical protein
VYCSIGFDVQWSYSCPECGEEHDFDTFAEMSDYAQTHDGRCESCTPEEEPETESGEDLAQFYGPSTRI